MILKNITCAGLNEKCDIKDAVDFFKKYRTAELGVQVSKSFFDKKNTDTWENELFLRLKEQKIQKRIVLCLDNKGSVALLSEPAHIDLHSFFQKNDGIRRIRADFEIGKDSFADGKIVPEINNLFHFMSAVYPKNVIFFGDESNRPLLSKMYYRGAQFDILYRTEDFNAQNLMKDIFYGFQIDFSKKDVFESLNMLNTLSDKALFIDSAESLKENGVFSFEKADKLMRKVRNWQAQHYLLTGQKQIAY